MQLCRSQTNSRLRKFTIINTVILTYIDIPMSCLYMPLFHALIFTCIDYRVCIYCIAISIYRITIYSYNLYITLLRVVNV